MQELVCLLQRSHLGEVRLEDWLHSISLALDDIAPEDPHYPTLANLEEELLAGHIPLLQLQDFARLLQAQDQPEWVTLEAEFEALAGSLPEHEWQTSHYQELLQALQELPEPELEQYLLQRRDSLNRVLESYDEVTMTRDEVTAETLVGHRLFSRGLKAWIEALELLLQPGPQPEALQQAEWGNRLLVSVQHLHRRVQFNC